jgi:glycosyltransferase involved in cell wall biosynthesis
MSDLFHIVTPSMNSAAFIHETILSVVQQAGDFRIRYHVQDGGSSDGTIEILRRWSSLLRDGLFPVRCQGLEFSFSQEPDRGMYDAINLAFRKIHGESPCLMSWINADDRFTQGAFATVTKVMAAFGKPCVVLSARHALCDENGALTILTEPMVFPQASLAAGFHDTRRLNVVMQEGVFWRSELWARVSGLRPELRLAGDFDLWRRMSKHSEFVAIDNVLAVHRRHPGQLTHNLDPYLAEIDASLGDRGVGDRDTAWNEFDRSPWKQTLAEQKGYVGTLATYDYTERAWSFTTRSVIPRSVAVVDHVISPGLRKVALPLVPRGGFGKFEGPYDQWGLPWPVAWATSPACTLEIPAEVRGQVDLYIVCRNHPSPIEARLSSEDGEQSAAIEIPVTGTHKDFLLTARIETRGRTKRFLLHMRGGEPRNTWILFVNGWVAFDPPSPWWLPRFRAR